MPRVIAIVGRPNVGKSALFNRIAGRRIAIVHDQPGVTRDRVMAECEFRGKTFTLIDTGGIGLRRGEKSDDIITQAAVEQVELAIEAADAIVFVVNVQEGLVPLDLEVAGRLREAGKPVLVAVNKSDTEAAEEEAVDFSGLGFATLHPVSAIHGRGIEALLRAAIAHLPEAAPEPADATVATGEGEASEEEEEDFDDGSKPYVSRRRRQPPPPRDFGRDPLRLAIVGRPNVGKSSLINALTQSTRVVVSPIPGTTRDAVDVPFEVETEGRREKYVLVDTAGVRKRRSIDNSIEFFSVKRTEEAISRSDITVLVLDAGDGILEQDKKIGALITEARRACIVVVNKWDLVAEKVQEARIDEIRRRDAREQLGDREKRMTTLGEFGQWVQEKLFFLDYAPVIFTSAQSGFHLDRLLEAVRYVAAQLQQEIPTAVLNRTLQDAVTRRQPVSDRGHVLRFYYATQIGRSPAKFLLFMNRGDLFNRAYEKYLADQLRTAFGFEGCPLVLIPRERPKTVESVRKAPPGGGGRRRSSGGGRPTGPRREERGEAKTRGGPVKARTDQTGPGRPVSKGARGGDRPNRSRPDRARSASGPRSRSGSRSDRSGPGRGKGPRGPRRGRA